MIAFTWIFIVLFAGVQCASRIKRQSDRGPLYDYVHRDDGKYSWEVFDEIPQDGFTTYYINVTTQQWYDETLLNRPVWWHYLVVHIPDTIVYPNHGFLYISSGSNNDAPPGLTSDHVRRTGIYAYNTGIVAGVIRFVPNQPIVFEGDGVDRYEDEIIAWTWRRFYNESHVGIDNPDILLHVPMVKAASKALDTISNLVLEKRGNTVDQFMAAGLSKRGWTTWLLGVVDDRVVALAPVVLSCVNMAKVFHHYYQSMGGWTFAIYDYWQQGIMGLLDEPEMLELQKINDPYFYLDHLTMPKLMVSAASDEFFMPDDYDYFFRDLLGEKYIWLLENSGHSINQGPVYEQYWTMLETFYISVIDEYQMPVIDWAKEATTTDGSILLLSPVTPINITSFSALSAVPFRRDWRTTMLDENMNPIPTGVTWIEGPVEDVGNNYYRAYYEAPESGYLCFFIKICYPGPNGRVYYFTTEANIIPNTWPYEDCVGSACQGTLV